MVEIPDASGLICGFRLRSGAKAEPLPPNPADWLNGEAGESIWLHFNLADTRAKRWIESCPHIPVPARERLLDEDRHVVLAPAGPGLAGVLADVHYDFDADPESLEVLRLYLDEKIIVTGRTHPLKVADQLRRQLAAGELIENPLQLLAVHIEELGSLLATLTRSQGDLVDDIEDRILKDHYQREGAELGRTRRLVARLRRHVGAEKQALHQMIHRAPKWCHGEDAARLRLALEVIDGVVLDLESIQERSRLLQEEIASRMTEATNRNLYVLSIVTVIFMPITLITGMFGMNVGGLPWLENHEGFWWVTGFMALTAAVSFALLHWRRFF